MSRPINALSQPTLIVLAALVLSINALAAASVLGRVDFPTSGSPEAQPHFIQGVLLLHSFEYDDAREEFQQAQKLDPGFAMAYWGEAMTHNKPIWVRQDRKAGQAVLKHLGATLEERLAKAPAEREKGYLRAIDVIFFGEGDKEARDFAYADAMLELARRFPEDLEAAAFYALAVLGTAQGVRDFRTYMRAAAVVEEVFNKNPEHPGATHYLIHSYDDAIHAPLGLRPARVYAKIAPAAAHALHMPSHIFVALGMWEETAASNEDSWAAADARVKRKGLTVQDRSYHALWWLQYAYLQQGRYREAAHLQRIMEEDVTKLSVPVTRRHLAAMRAQYLIETRRWDEADKGPAVDLSGVNTEQSAGHWLATGMSAAKTGDLPRAKKALTEIEGLLATDEDKPQYSTEDQAAEVAKMELEVLIAFAEGKQQQALDLMKRATEAEEAMPLAYGPPAPVKPSHELYGEMLLEAGRPAEAMVQFEIALSRAPRRALSLLGLARAAEKSGDKEAASSARGDLGDVWGRADPQVRKLLPEPSD